MARLNRANLLFEIERFDDAANDYQAVRDGDPNCPAYVTGYMTLCRLHCCDWGRLEEERSRIGALVEAGQFVLDPIGNIILFDQPAKQMDFARVWATQKYPAAPVPLWRGDVYRHDKIRVAYLSADFRTHATALLMAGVFEAHDRSRFEITAISFGADDKSPMRARLESGFDRFIDVRAIADAEVAKKLREAEIDIAVDLKGYTQEGRPGILAHRPAPIQAQYLGYPGTMAAAYYDYVIADPIVIPEEHRPFFSEQVAYLPDTYQCNDSKRAIAPRAPRRSEMGLPENGFVFCCFNNNHKILPEMFDIWMRLLTPGRQQRALASAGQSRGGAQPFARSHRPRRRAGTARVRAALHAGGPSRAAASRRSVPRYAALQRAHDLQRCAVGGAAGAYRAGRMFRRAGGGEPAFGAWRFRAGHAFAGRV